MFRELHPSPASRFNLSRVHTAGFFARCNKIGSFVTVVNIVVAPSLQFPRKSKETHRQQVGTLNVVSPCSQTIFFCEELSFANPRFACNRIILPLGQKLED